MLSTAQYEVQPASHEPASQDLVIPPRSGLRLTRRWLPTASPDLGPPLTMVAWVKKGALVKS